MHFGCAASLQSTIGVTDNFPAENQALSSELVDHFLDDGTRGECEFQKLTSTKTPPFAATW